ncbi:MAG: GIY-YIG nuclease family protein [Sphingobacteriales bacterium]|jgi:putative endonuclease|nr:GIY-YIG nuclease family protein [Sphingobacteriales bacterium]
MQRGGCVYILTNKNKTTLYVGVTADLFGRIQEHKCGLNKYSFSYKYNLHYLIYYEFFSRIEEAIAREKEIKKWRREKKENLINSMNPQWNDLIDSEDI